METLTSSVSPCVSASHWNCYTWLYFWCFAQNTPNIFFYSHGRTITPCMIFSVLTKKILTWLHLSYLQDLLRQTSFFLHFLWKKTWKLPSSTTIKNGAGQFPHRTLFVLLTLNLLGEDPGHQAHCLWRAPVLSERSHCWAFQLVHGPVSFLHTNTWILWWHHKE